MLELSATSTLSDQDRRGVAALAADLEARFGAPPLNDAALIALGDDTLTHLLARDGGGLVGYAQLDQATATAEVAGADEVAATLLDAVRDRQPGSLVWAHGQHSPVGAAAQTRGYPAVRTLWQLRRPLTDLAPIPPHDVPIRPFEVGRDEAAWLELNAAAFAHHPEQGSWTRADLIARENEDWFDPAGFLLAERDGQLLGFHWTKVHPGGLGEVYVLAVAPAAQGLRLGKTLLAAGLHHLAERGQHTVLLYVDDDNPTALALYEGSGFTRYDRDVQYRVG